ncbi:hypothetical protein EDD85DRAFT_959507 [Armillaria nabsnona]|nr:hypothetical protein EDD85DRAFT_959507 [Armillaria nabsnona]
MAPFTRSKGVVPILELPPWGNTKKASAASAELPPVQSKNNADLLGDLESPLTSIASLWPDNSIRGSGPISIDEKGLFSWPVKEESIASGDFDLPGHHGGHDNANELSSVSFETAFEPDLLNLKDDSMILHPDNVKGWETVGKKKGRCTPSPDPSSNLAGFVASTNNRFDVLSESDSDEKKVAIDHTVKFVHDVRQKHFEKKFLNIPKQVQLEREAAEEVARLEALARELGTEKSSVHDSEEGYETDIPVDKPFINKRKVHDFRDTGIPGINNEELDPENQCRALENFDFLNGEDSEMQKAIYEGIVSAWKTYKQKTAGSEPPVGGPSNAKMAKPKPKKKVEIVEETYGEDALSDGEQPYVKPKPRSESEHSNIDQDNIRNSPANVGREISGHGEKVTFTPSVMSTLRPKPTKTVRIFEEEGSKEMLDSTMGANNGKSKSSSPLLSNTGNPGGMRGRSPMSGSNVRGNPHIDLQNMIDVSRNAMRSNNHCETPNVRTGPAFAADQVAPNSYLGKVLKKPNTGDGAGLPPDDPGDSSSESSSSSSSSSSDDESGGSDSDSRRR